MNILAKKLNLIEKLIGVSDTTTINKVDKLLNNNASKAYESKQKSLISQEDFEKEIRSGTSYSWKNALKFFKKHTISFKNYKFDREEANAR